MTKSFVKKGDKVLVITGKDKGKVADVVEVSPKSQKVLVDGVNVVTKHQKPKSQQEKGGIIKKSAPIEASNVMVVCPACGKATRVAHKELNGKNIRVCKKCGATLDKEFAKEVKKEAKKATKAKKEVKGE
ncbi:MAG: 50S ribosomal protein L24 [Clostridia bacterium]|nr:50S ribosomal protein L24 [Clostridia bacterium]